eukprot:764384-Hanusia_phi.AAC.2
MDAAPGILEESDLNFGDPVVPAGAVRDSSRRRGASHVLRKWEAITLPNSSGLDRSWVCSKERKGYFEERAIEQGERGGQGLQGNENKEETRASW